MSPTPLPPFLPHHLPFIPNYPLYCSFFLLVELPEPFELDGEMLGELKDVLSLKFSFSSAFSNVLFVTIASQSLRRDGWSVDLSIDEQSLVRYSPDMAIAVVCVHACVRACVRACVCARACMCACKHACMS